MALEGMRDQRHAPAALYPRERPGTHCTGGWVGPRAGLDRRGKSRHAPGFDPRTVLPVASRYTHYATRTHNNLCAGRKMDQCWRREMSERCGAVVGANGRVLSNVLL